MVLFLNKLFGMVFEEFVFHGEHFKESTRKQIAEKKFKI